MGVALMETFSLLFHGFKTFHIYCIQVLDALYNVKNLLPFQKSQKTISLFHMVVNNVNYNLPHKVLLRLSLLL